MNKTVAVLVAICSLIANSANAVECSMRPRWEHQATRTPIYYQGQELEPSVFYVAKAAVNTDGSPKSYHPMDPRGKSMALNNIVNASRTPYNRTTGKYLACGVNECFSKWIAAFEAARDAQYKPTAPWIYRTGSMIPWADNKALGYAQPCLQTGNYEGYFVTQTAYSWYRGAACDQARYIDGLVYNGNVLPLETAWGPPKLATDGFDLVVMVPPNGEPVFGFNYDRGPASKIGEISVAAAAELVGNPNRSFTTYDEVKTLALPEISYLIFPLVDMKRRLGPNFTQQQVNAEGQTVFAQWGGLERLRACLDQERKAAMAR